MSPYKDPEKAREATKERVRRYREKQKDVTPNRVMPSGGRVTPSLLNYLIDPEKRRKLESICMALGRRDLGGEVRFGPRGVTFKEVEELLDATS